MDEKFIEVKQLYKTFHTQKQDIEVLRGIDLSVGKGDIYGIVGFSGAGKSTLVRCINRLEEPDSGSVRIGDKEITSLGKAELNRQRRKIGMIFQQFNLFDSMTVTQNIAYPLKMAGMGAKEVRARVDEMLALVGLSEKRDAYPGELSGGQKQRVGIARALANNPKLLLADEPTGALDSHSSQTLLETFTNLNDTLGTTIFMVTHDAFSASYCSRILFLRDGKIFHELLRGEKEEERKEEEERVYSAQDVIKWEKRSRKRNGKYVEALQGTVSRQTGMKMYFQAALIGI